MKFDLDYIENLADIINKKNLTELVLEDGGQSIKIKKDNALGSAVVSQTVNELNTIGNNSTEITEQEKTLPSIKEPTAVVSPMVGTFYSAPTPDAQPFVKVGDVVATGQVVCVIEAMKLMNEIEAEVSGKITKILVENGQPVEYGQVLMYVE